jgi:aldose 1-epimerase
LLSAGELRATVAPAVGGSIASFSRHWKQGRRERSLQWLRPASPEALASANPLGMASFPLLPFCNRIRNGQASFEGREIRFPPNHPSDPSPHPLHGIGWQRPWDVVSSNAGEAEIRLQVPASSAWPWQFSARQRFRLSADRLEVTMQLTNEDATAAMPAGIGPHPYFPHTPGTRLTSATEAMWLGNAEVMPTKLETNDVVRQLRAGVELSALDLDNNFTGWKHEALVEWPADLHGPQRSLVMRAESPLDFFVLYCPRGDDHFCAEPVSNCTDWLNLLAQYGQDAVGGARLAPGETLEARFSFTPRWS